MVLPSPRDSDMREFLKIVALSVAASVLYGLVHDQITIRVSPAYFTVFHPPIFPQHNLTILALCWGVAATWWAGLMSGVVLALAARAGREPRIAAAELIKPIAILLLVMACCATVAGFLGYHVALDRTREALVPGYPAINVNAVSPLMADLWTHTASYAIGFGGTIVLCVMTLLRRLERSRRGLGLQASGLPISQ